MGSGKGHCDKRDLHVYPEGSGRDNREWGELGVGGGKDKV